MMHDLDWALFGGVMALCGLGIFRVVAEAWNEHKDYKRRQEMLKILRNLGGPK
jgi:hypothetical protein